MRTKWICKLGFSFKDLCYPLHNDFYLPHRQRVGIDDDFLFNDFHCDGWISFPQGEFQTGICEGGSTI